jgi:hypothetical protein
MEPSLEPIMELPDQRCCSPSPHTAPKFGADGRPWSGSRGRAKMTAQRCSPYGRRHCYGRAAATGGCHVVSSGPANGVDSAIALREPGQPLRIEHDHHLFRVFPDAMWRRLIDDSVSSLSTSTTPMQTNTWCSLVGVPPAEKFRRQIEAG